MQSPIFAAFAQSFFLWIWTGAQFFNMTNFTHKRNKDKFKTGLVELTIQFVITNLTWGENFQASQLTFTKSCTDIPLVPILTDTGIWTVGVLTNLRWLTQASIITFIDIILTISPSPASLTHTANHIVTVQGMMSAVTWHLAIMSPMIKITCW